VTISSILMFALAAGLLLLAHVTRALRWSLLFPRNNPEPETRGLLTSLGIGYAINAVIPLRIGEFVRGWVASRTRRSRFSEVMATIVAERIADVAVVSAFVGGLWLSAHRSVSLSMLAYPAAVVALMGLALALRSSSALRRLFWRAAGIFNPRLRLAVSDFIWSTAEIVVGGTLLRWQFSLITFFMWTTYVAAYGCFAAAVGVSLGDVMQALLLQPWSSFLIGPRGSQVDRVALAIFVLLPVAVIVASRGLRFANRSLAHLARWLRFAGPRPHFSSSTRYSHPSSYEDFLDALFSDARATISGFGRRGVNDCIVHRYFNGGSEALTALVETGDGLLIRKFGLGAAATKLRQQAAWLEQHSGAGMPLVPVIGVNSNVGAFSYDMPLVERCSEFYEMTHSSPMGDSSGLLLRILDRIDALHASGDRPLAPSGAIDGYFQQKIARNAEQIVRFARSAIGDEEYLLNGEAHRLDEWRCLQDRDWVNRQIRARQQTLVHGDLTMENVVVSPDDPSGFYVIDPNPENIFDSPLIDWAKIMQSLHLGYEALNRSAHTSVVDRSMTLPIARSEAYASLHRLFESELVSRFSDEVLREIYFHELVHYLRLTPYKMRQSRERGLAFFGCASLLLRRYRDCYA
jgi:aminoglycoside phosphotransferase (APT) family kinase protein